MDRETRTLTGTTVLLAALAALYLYMLSVDWLARLGTVLDK